MEKGTEIKVVWEDAFHWSDEVTELEVLREPVTHYTTWGRLLLDSPTHLIVVSTRDEEDNMIKEATRIPKSLIRKVIEMKED